VAGRSLPWTTALRLLPGEVLTLGPPRAGLRSYLSVAGGIDVPPELGSRSADVLSGLGPPQLAAAMFLPVGEPPDPRLRAAPAPGEPFDQVAVLDLLPGPRTDWLDDAAALAGDWKVSPRSNRVGVRLEGPALARKPALVSAELPSEPLVRGAVQLPPAGQPVIFGPDHPTTGGYPVVAVLTEAASDRLAQCRPGELVRLVWTRGSTAG
jgi:biotin-dependent carboxylase-like uncharacterized protein